MTNTETLQQLVLSKITGVTKLHVGFSGGVDSHALLVIAAELKQAGHIKELQAIHINHSINPDSELWAEHCKKIAHSLDVPCKVVTVKLPSTANLEHNARVARYEEFSKIVHKDEALLLAHHLDDQVETILMRLFKGTGATGICGMKEITTIADLKIIRPLLDVPKDTLLDFAKKQQLEYITDPSNKDCDLDRNYIRHNIIPSIKARWPNAPGNITRSVAHIVGQEEYISDYCHAILQKISDANKLSISALADYSQPEQQMLIRAWIIKHNTYAPSTATLQQIFQELIHAKVDRNPVIKIKDIELRRFKQHIYLLAHKPQTGYIPELIWPQDQKTIYIPAIDKILQRNNSSRIDFTIRFRKGGEKITGAKDEHSKTLKNFMHENEIPPWERNTIPLIYSGDELVCVVGLFAKKDFNISYA